MDFKELALEYVKIYFSCHSDKLPEDKEKAFREMDKLYGRYKSHLIDEATRKSEDFFSDKM